MSSRIVVASLFVSGLVVACANAQVDPIPASDESSTVPAPDAGAKASGSSAASEPDAGKKKPAPADPGDPAPTAGACAGEASFDACVTCCSNAHPDGSDTFYGTYVMCLCETANCGLECGTTLCDPVAPTQADAACSACIQAQGNNCQADVSAACSADPDCIAFDTCVGDSQCGAKP